MANQLQSGRSGQPTSGGNGGKEAVESVAAEERRKWDAYYQSLPAAEEYEPVKGFNVELMSLVSDLLPEGGNILEAGSGAGLQSLALARAGRFRMSLMDFSEQALGHARKLFSQQNLNAEFLLGDVFAEDSGNFDLVFNAGVLEHYSFDQQVAFVRGMASRSRNYVLVLVPNRLCYWYWIWRVQAAANAEWPYGKEVPRTDLSSVLSAAGVHSLGRVFLGETWTESFVNSLAGLDERMRKEILDVHRSRLVPLPQRAYLLAALGSVRSDVTAPACWVHACDEDPISEAERLATAADALAVRLGADRQLQRSQAEAQASICDLTAQRDRAREVEADLERRLITLRARAAESDATIAQLRRRVAESERRAREATEQLDVTKEQAIAVRERLAGVDHQLHLIVTSTGWAVLQFLWRIRLVLAPRGSLREQIAKLPLRFIRALRGYSVRDLPARVWDRLLAAMPDPMSWPAYRFDMFKRARKSIYTSALDGLRCPSVSGLVSVVLPVYNGQDYVTESLDSILAQTYPDLEVIIVDDGSTDDTPRILQAYAQGDRRIRIVRQENQGLPRALSAGFRAAQGEFLTWASADNRLKVDFLRQMVSCLRRHPGWDAIYANKDIIGEDGEPLRNSGWYEDYQTPRGSEHITLPSDPSELNIVANNYVGAGFMYRDRVDALLGDYSRYRFGTEDYDYWMRVNALFALRHVDFSESVCEYRFHDDSLTSRDEELGITRSRAALMAFEDFRRDLYLTPVAWQIEGEDAGLARRLRRWVERAGHTVLEMPGRAHDLPTLWFPVVCVKVASRCDAIVPPAAWPTGALKVFVVTGDGPLPESVDSAWDVCVATRPDVPLSRLSTARQGWFGITSTEVLCTALDIRVKQRELARIEDAVATSGEEPRKIAVVICTYRRPAALERALRSVAEQSLAPDEYEVVVVNNDPRDMEITQVVEGMRREAFDGSPERLRLVQCPFTGLSHARNAGIAEARSILLAFLDDDAVATPDWLEQLWAAREAHPNAGVIGGTILLEAGSESRWVRPGWEKFWGQYIPRRSESYSVDGWWEFPWGGNWAATRRALLTIGGFRCGYGRRGSDFGGGEEVVASCLVREIGLDIVVAPGARVIHAPDAGRFSLRHIWHTVAASKNTEYRKQVDLYIPMTLDVPTIRAVAGEHLRIATRRDGQPRHVRAEHWMYVWATLRLLRYRIADEVRRRRTPSVMGA